MMKSGTVEGLKWYSTYLIGVRPQVQTSVLKKVMVKST
jgi:hypothetical protein